MVSRTRLFVVALLFGIALSACEVEVGSFGASIGGDANFSVTMYQGQDVVGGEQVDLKEVVDQAPLVLYFYGGQCEQCLGEFSTLQAFYDEHKDDITVLAVDVGHLIAPGNLEDGRKLLAEANVTIPAGYASDDSVVLTHEIDTLPITSFYRKGAGRYRARVSGGLWQSDLLDNVDEILGQLQGSQPTGPL